MGNLEEKTQTVTVKFGTGYDAPWHVIYFNTGDELRHQLKEFYEIDEPDQPLYVLVGIARDTAKSGSALVSGLGARRGNSKKAAPQDDGADSEQHEESTQAGSSAQDAQSDATQVRSERDAGATERDRAMADIERMASAAEVPGLMGKYRQLIRSDAELRKALKDKRDSLQGTL